MRLKFWKRKESKQEVEWSDPLDPHGDGTLRAGDPIFDAMMRGEAIMGNFGPNGWEYDTLPAEVVEVEDDQK